MPLSSDATMRALAASLRLRIKGEVRFDDASRAMYATDASNYRQVPIGVVVPRDLDDVLATVELCRRAGAPILARGGGTSVAGQCCNVAVVLDTSKSLRAIREIDPVRKLARVEPGVVLDQLRDAAEKHHLTFGPDPATHNHCTLGGMIGNDSCGVHSIMAGRTSHNVESLDVLTYDGTRLQVGATSDDQLAAILREGGRRAEIYRALLALRDRYGDEIRRRTLKIPRLVSGYNLAALLPENGFHVARALVGTEGTCVTVLEATLRLVHSPRHRVMLVLGYPDVALAGDHVPEVMRWGPIGLEGMDDVLVEALRKKRPDAILPALPEGKGWLLCEFGGESPAEALAAAERAAAGLRGTASRIVVDPSEQLRLWRVRESGLGTTSRIPGERDRWEGWEDSAVPPETLGGYLRALRLLLDRFGYRCSFYGHFGDGCLHTRIDFDFATRAGVDTFRHFLDEAADLVVSFGGSLSGEHGDGQSRAELLPKMFGPEMIDAFRAFKAIWDPENKMNPGKLVDPRKITDDLRLGPDYRPATPETHFRFPADDRKLARAVNRCVGIGECRRESGGTMCPSYRVTHDEQHSTRGRARLLHEMLNGDPIADGWRDEGIKEALDLCLACKGCKVDCPVGVDMATYKAEFLSHHYQGRLRPRSAYAFGLIDRWAHLASAAPGLVNLVMASRGLGQVAKAAAGMAPARPVPRFASRTFRRWFRQRNEAPARGTPVVLWADTFSNHFHPQIAIDAVTVLEAAGFDVRVPRARLCCGRPLYDYGMLDRAERLLKKTMTALRTELEAGLPIVVLEPSCLAVFRDELPNLFPDEPLAKRLAMQSQTLAQLLVGRPNQLRLPPLPRQAVVQRHCHQSAVIGFDAETEILRTLGLEAKTLDGGCCGMAGSFGFEASHYEMSMRVGEHAVLPAVRATADDALVIADGFSCREQISHGAKREAVHIASVIRQALQKKVETQP